MIDVQKGMFAHATPHLGDQVVETLAGMLARAREQGVPVFFVQHDGGAQSPLVPGTDGFELHDALTPQAGEEVIVKRYCNAFQDTDLLLRLTTRGIDHIVVGGMQSEFCVDTAVRGAFERGLKVTLIADGHTTFDTPALPAPQIIAHHNHTLASGHFAEVAKAAEIGF
uniref:cysteine hydrolase family protein n=1 Tax=uncultured Altererythrobacter sp. TaxID=500840 RepID=UPI00261C4288|nr:cysteine hydrolase family protein [uncultured Altererythrobacter sp.]